MEPEETRIRSYRVDSNTGRYPIMYNSDGSVSSGDLTITDSHFSPSDEEKKKDVLSHISVDFGD